MSWDQSGIWMKVVKSAIRIVWCLSITMCDSHTIWIYAKFNEKVQTEQKCFSNPSLFMHVGGKFVNPNFHLCKKLTFRNSGLMESCLMEAALITPILSLAASMSGPKLPTTSIQTHPGTGRPNSMTNELGQPTQTWSCGGLLHLAKQ